MKWVVYALLIINKAGGLVYNRTFHSGLNVMNTNDLLVLAGTFHGIHAISRNLSPTSADPRDATGIESLQTSRFLLSCRQTLTGTKFLLFTEPAQANTEAILHRCYELYSDFVMKNPFYSLEMPIRCEKFERALQGWIAVR
ncbi:MAG: hypothetical protein M1831_002815 [Alyxoria varia]|nr:MAG: hypothetical protein M1831_002815 [Alyxoria varia]